MSDPRGCRLPGLVLLVALLAGCASIPTSGPVKAGGDSRVQRVEDGVPFIGQPPGRGASPEDIVRGFVQSSADFLNDHDVARQYLAPTARQRWRPQAGTIVYDRVASALAVQVAPDSTVTVEAAQLGRIDADGAFTRSPAGTTVVRSYRMTRVDGQWRIASLDDGLLLSSADVAETYRQVDLYFLAPSGRTLVPDLVLIPEAPGLTTKLVARLLRGPTAALRGAVTTAFPQGTGLEVGSVPVRDGTATVRLDATALGGDDTAREQMSAQLVWTLKQLPEILRVRITAGGEDLAVSGVAQVQSRDAWQPYDPDHPLSATPSAYVVRDGRVGRYLGNGFEPVAGAAGTGAPPLGSPAVNLDASRVAAVSTDRRTVYVGRLARDAPLLPRIRGTDLSRPSWDPGNNLWVVDRASGTLWYLADGSDRPQQVEVRQPGVRGLLSAVAVARDGARVALVVGTGRGARVAVGSVQRAAGNDQNTAGEVMSVQATRQPLPDLAGVRDVAWADPGTLAVLGSQAGAALAPLYTSTDGYVVRDVPPLEGAVTLAMAPPATNPLVAGTADGQLEGFTAGDGWTPIGAGADPAYPG